MKIKKVVFTFTGETRCPKAGEWFKDVYFYTQATRDYTCGIYPIYTMQEIKEEWKPKENERYYFPSIYNPDYFDVTHFCSDNELDKNRLQLGLCYPWTDEGKELVIQKAKQILEFLKKF